MSESATPAEVPAVETPVVETPATSTEEIPEHLKPYVKSLRDEAAKARHEKKDAVDAAVSALKATHAAELAARDTRITEIENDLGGAWIELEKLHTTLAAKVPSDRVLAFASFLQGDDKESIGESAKAAYQLAGGFDSKTPAFDPSLGQGGGGKTPLALNGDGIMKALLAAVNKGQ